MKQPKNTSKRKILIIISAILAVAIIAAGGLLAWDYYQSSKTVQSEGKNQGQVFSFDSSKAPSWWSPGNYTPTDEDVKNYATNSQTQGLELPIASINAFQGEANEFSQGCFVMVFKQKGTISIDALLQERVKGISGNNSRLSAELIGTVAQTIQTPEGPKDYTLYQYDVSGSSDIQKGNEFGFIALDDSYIEIRGVCPTASQLPETLTGLSAIELKN